ncbi:MAG: PAS domain S-box protein [Candidatus Acidiferrum sp.]
MPDTTLAVPSPSALSSDNTFRLLVDQITDYAIFLLTPNGEVQTWNPGAERIKRYHASEIIGRHFRIFYSPEAQRARIPEDELKIAATGRFEDEGWRIRKDGTKFWANVIITAIRNSAGKLVAYGKVTRDLTERKRSEEQLRELSHTLLKMQDEERGRLGRELHDSVGQYLVAVKMALDALSAEQSQPAPPPHGASEGQKQIADSIALVDRAIREVRTLSYLLYPPMLEEMGLPSAIRWHLEGFSQRSGITIQYDIAPDVRLRKDIELALFRVFQESLTNVHRHSQSKTARIRFAIDGATAVLEVKDQGVGLPAVSDLNDASLGKLGVGIRSMRERIQQLGGNLFISSSSQGTTVRATVPIEILSPGAQTTA